MVNTGGIGGPKPVPGKAAFRDKQAIVESVLKRDPATLKTHGMQKQINPHMQQGISLKGAQASRRVIAEAEHRPETEQLRSETKKTANFISFLVAHVKTMLGRLNFFAYFYKKPENLSHAVHFLISVLDKEKYLKEEGIFWFSGSKTVIDSTVEQLSSTDELSEKLIKGLSVHDLAGVLKAIFSRMLIFGTPQLQEKFLLLGKDIFKLEERERIRRMKELVVQLPASKQKDLKEMITFLAKVYKYQRDNNMDAEKLAIAFGQRMVSIQTTEEMKNALQPATAMAKNFILFHDQIFE